MDEERLTLRDGSAVLIRPVRLESQPEVAEAAVAVIDEWQHRGVGSELLRRLTERARENGIQRFQARLFAFNDAVIALFGGLGELEVHHADADQLEIDVQLPCEPAAGLGAALRAAATGLVRLRP